MSYFMSCQKCGKETIGRYATENSLCGECISDIDSEPDTYVKWLDKHMD